MRQATLLLFYPAHTFFSADAPRQKGNMFWLFAGFVPVRPLSQAAISFIHFLSTLMTRYSTAGNKDSGFYRNAVLRLLLLFLFAGATATGFSQPVSSINAYYDSYRLIEFEKDPDTAKAKTVLQILKAYSSEQDSYSFSDPKLTALYQEAVKTVFFLHKVVEHAPLSKDSTLMNMVDVYKRELAALQRDSVMLQKLQDKWLRENVLAVYQPVTDTGFVVLDTSAVTLRLSSQLKMAFADYSFLLDSLPPVSLALAKSEKEMLERLPAYTFFLSAEMDERIGGLNEKITQQVTQIQKYFSKHYASLNKEFIKQVSGLGAKADAFLKENKEFFSPESLAVQSTTNDDYYYKNETYTLTNFKLPSQTEMIDALAIYLAKRLKQEVALTLMDQFRKIIKQEQFIFDLFPETYKMFQSGKVYEMPSFGKAWNYAISKDFSNLLTNLSKSAYIHKKIGDTMLVAHLQDVVSMCNLINKQYSYVDVIAQLQGDELKSGFFKKTVQTLYILNKELFDTSDKGLFWISPDKLYSLPENRAKLMFALVAAKYKDGMGLLEISNWNKVLTPRRLQNSIASLLLLLNNFQAQQRRFSKLTGEQQLQQPAHYWNFLNDLFAALDVINPELKNNSYLQRFVLLTNASIETYSLLTQKNYAGAALKIMELLPVIKDNDYVDLEGLVLSTKHLHKYSDDENKLQVEDIKQQFSQLGAYIKKLHFLQKLKKELENYNTDFRLLSADPRLAYYRTAFNHASSRNERNILLPLLNSDLKQVEEYINTMKSSIRNSAFLTKHQHLIQNNLDSVVKGLMVAFTSQEVQDYIARRFTDQFEVFRKLTGFLSDVMVAGNSKNLSLVIERYAMPPNSYKIKRASKSSWDVNAYVGVYAGREFDQPFGLQSGGWVWGLSAPIGVSYSWGKTKATAKHSYFSSEQGRALNGNANSLTLSLIDIGAVVSYRINNDSEGLPEKVRWAQVLSPGIHFRWGIKETPLCISTGLQYTPQLRTLKNGGNQAGAVRAYVGAFFDLPLFNISHQ